MTDRVVGGGAYLSEDGVYRYWLRRTLSRQLVGGGRCVFVMLNPSTADGSVDDPTIRRCKAFASAFGCAALEVVNLFAYRATDPADLFAALARGVDIVGPDNPRHLARAVAAADLVVAAWGARAPVDRIAEVVAEVGECRWHCLGVTAGGDPRHPLYVRADAPLVQWSPNLSVAS